LLHFISVRCYANIPVDKKLYLSRMDDNVMEVDMWDVAVTFMFMFFGAFVVIAFGAVLIWMLYLIQNGVDDE